MPVQITRNDPHTILITLFGHVILRQRLKKHCRQLPALARKSRETIAKKTTMFHGKSIAFAFCCQFGMGGEGLPSPVPATEGLY